MEVVWQTPPARRNMEIGDKWKYLRCYRKSIGERRLDLYPVCPALFGGKRFVIAAASILSEVPLH